MVNAVSTWVHRAGGSNWAIVYCGRVGTEAHTRLPHLNHLSFNHGCTCNLWVRRQRSQHCHVSKQLPSAADRGIIQPAASRHHSGEHLHPQVAGHGIKSHGRRDVHARSLGSIVVQQLHALDELWGNGCEFARSSRKVWLPQHPEQPRSSAAKGFFPSRPPGSPQMSR